ncbi:MAG: DinB family protein [Candidatus Acidiferrales bacterium]
MKKLLCSALLFGLAAIPAIAQGGGGAAQTPPPSGAPQQMAPVVDPLATYVKNGFKGNANYLVHSADDMPEENFSAKLGTTAEARTFAQMLGHTINANFRACANAKGEKNPNAVDFEHTPQTKADLAKAMHAAVDYCTPVYDALTDASAMEMVTPQGPNGPGRPNLRVNILIGNVVHNNEMYGNLVGIFRAKNIVPPSTAGAGRRGM